jgi:hypothetical protein
MRFLDSSGACGAYGKVLVENKEGRDFLRAMCVKDKEGLRQDRT